MSNKLHSHTSGRQEHVLTEIFVKLYAVREERQKERTRKNRECTEEGNRTIICLIEVRGTILPPSNTALAPEIELILEGGDLHLIASYVCHTYVVITNTKKYQLEGGKKRQI